MKQFRTLSRLFRLFKIVKLWRKQSIGINVKLLSYIGKLYLLTSKVSSNIYLYRETIIEKLRSKSLRQNNKMEENFLGIPTGIFNNCIPKGFPSSAKRRDVPRYALLLWVCISERKKIWSYVFNGHILAPEKRDLSNESYSGRIILFCTQKLRISPSRFRRWKL